MTLISSEKSTRSAVTSTAKHKICSIQPRIAPSGRRPQLLVRVETEGGLVGWGECGLAGREKAVMGVLEHFEPLLIGRSAMDIGAIWQRLYRSQYYEGGRVLQAAISGLDIALHDLKGKALNVPVHQLLGGKQRDRIPVFASIPSTQFKTARETANAFYREGWRCIRLFPDFSNLEYFEPREEIARTAELCRNVRSDLGDDVVLGIDWHHRLSVAEAASFCQKLPTGTLDFLEEPIRDETPGAYEALRTMTDIPFAIGEEFSSKWQFLPYIERNIHQFNRIDVCNVGGLTEAMKVAAMSESHYVDMMPHNPLGPICAAATIHFCAAIPNMSWMEYALLPDGYNPDEKPPSPYLLEPELNGTNFEVPDCCGLGIEIDESLLLEELPELWQGPMLLRADGSLTNF
ncbi:MAG: mandelate racemase/muconate lactonizing enzyme family protein [Cognatishimia sp.]